MRRGGATFDETGRYRYRLWRRLGDGSTRVCFVLLNPSTADATRDDPTIRRCVGFARAWGFDRMDAVNCFAWRATDPRALRTAWDPVGPRNDAAIRRCAREADLVVAAWGNHAALLGRSARVCRILEETGASLWSFGVTGAGEPRHPLYLRRDATLTPLRPRPSASASHASH